MTTLERIERFISNIEKLEHIVQEMRDELIAEAK